MGTCANCKHWRPHAGSPTNMVCGQVTRAPRTQRPAATLMPDLAERRNPDVPLVMATSPDYGCVLYEE